MCALLIKSNTVMDISSVLFSIDESYYCVSGLIRDAKDNKIKSDELVDKVSSVCMYYVLWVFFPL